jgi:hypothetical protein
MSLRGNIFEDLKFQLVKLVGLLFTPQTADPLDGAENAPRIYYKSGDKKFHAVDEDAVDVTLDTATPALGGDLSGTGTTAVVAKINSTVVAGATNSTHGGSGNATKVLILDAGGQADGRSLNTDGTNLDALMTSQVKIATKTIANAALKTLHATPVEVIATPGSGKFLEIVSVHANLVYATAAFDDVGASEFLELRHTNGSGALLTQTTGCAQGFGDASADAHLLIQPATGIVPVDNANVVAYIAGGEWYAAAGGSALHLEVLYRVRTTAI